MRDRRDSKRVCGEPRGGKVETRMVMDLLIFFDDFPWTDEL